MRDVTVDACVLRGAGESIDLQSVHARSVLDKILDSRVYVLASRSLMDEWDKHESAYSIRWRAAIESKARFLEIKISDHVRVGLNLSMRNIDSSHARCAKKDEHLVITAISYFSMIISSEKASRSVFVSLMPYFGSIAEVLWVHPEQYENIGSVCKGEMKVPVNWSLCHK